MEYLPGIRCIKFPLTEKERRYKKYKKGKEEKKQEIMQLIAEAYLRNIAVPFEVYKMDEFDYRETEGSWHEEQEQSVPGGGGQSNHQLIANQSRQSDRSEW